jgi:hypothetical protein
MKAGSALIAGLALAILSACPAAALGRADVEDAQLRAALAAEGDSARLAALEPTLLASDRTRTKRGGLVLRLTLTTGRQLQIKDQPCSEAALMHCGQHRLVADLPSRHAFLVYLALYEGAEYWLVDDRSGRKIVLPAAPSFSPDASVFVTIDNDLAYGDSGIQVWGRSGDRAGVMWTVGGDPPPLGRVVNWKSRDEAVLEVWSIESDGREGPHKSALLKRGSKGWRLVEQ